MMFPAKMSLAELQAKFPNLQSEMLTQVKAEASQEATAPLAAKNAELQETVNKLSRDNKIMQACVKADRADTMEELLASDNSVEDAYLILLSEPKKEQSAADGSGSQFMKQVFQQTAAEPAGNNGNDPSSEEVLTQTQAEASVAKRFNLTKRSDILKKARREYSSLYSPLSR
jgi:hypothetical protein